MQPEPKIIANITKASCLYISRVRTEVRAMDILIWTFSDVINISGLWLIKKIYLITKWTIVNIAGIFLLYNRRQHSSFLSFCNTNNLSLLQIPQKLVFYPDVTLRWKSIAPSRQAIDTYNNMPLSVDSTTIAYDNLGYIPQNGDPISSNFSTMSSTRPLNGNAVMMGHIYTPNEDKSSEYCTIRSSSGGTNAGSQTDITGRDPGSTTSLVRPKFRDVSDLSDCIIKCEYMYACMRAVNVISHIIWPYPSLIFSEKRRNHCFK